MFVICVLFTDGTLQGKRGLSVLQPPITEGAIVSEVIVFTAFI